MNSPILVYSYGVLGTNEEYNVTAVFSSDTNKSRVTFLAFCTKGEAGGYNFLLKKRFMKISSLFVIKNKAYRS